ncbi:hypothetical protein V8E54_006484 [Elaphomyces granulatus]
MPRIPFEGSEFEPPQVRAQQADGLSRSMKNELTALRTLTEGHCESSPILIAEKLGLQVHIWDFSRSVRDDIRNAFKIAWEDCLRAGVINQDKQLRKLLWDETQQKIYIVGFRLSRLSNENDTWKDNLWIKWCLADAPYKGTREILDMKTLHVFSFQASHLLPEFLEAFNNIRLFVSVDENAPSNLSPTESQWNLTRLLLSLG